jgi:biopolymer transport protein ExbB/TolQ
MVELILQGGMFMVPLLACSIIGLAIIADRWFYLRSAWKEAESILPAVNDLIARGDIDGVEKFCEEKPGPPHQYFPGGREEV